MKPVLDPEASAFLAELETLDIPSDGRARYSFLCDRFKGPRVEVAGVADLDGPPRLRHYRSGSDRGLLVWFHGGRLMTGNLETHDSLCRRLCRSSGWDVLAVDYRLAPEHRYPAALEDASRAVEIARALSPRIAVGGDSAGAALALWTAAEAEAAVFLYPMVDPSGATESYRLFHDGPGPSGAVIIEGWREFQAPPDVMDRCLPAPRNFVLTVEVDPLRDEGIALARRIGAEHMHVERMIHGVLTYPARFSLVETVTARVAAFLNEESG